MFKQSSYIIVNNDQAHHQSFPRPMGGQELEASDVEGGLSSFTHLYDLIIINYNLYGLIIVPIATNWNFNDETNYNADQIVKYIKYIISGLTALSTLDGVVLLAR